MWHVELEQALCEYLAEVTGGEESSFLLTEGEQMLWSAELDDAPPPCGDPEPLPVPEYVPIYRGHSRKRIVAPTVVRVWVARPEPPTSDDNLHFDLTVEVVYEQCVYDDDVFLSLMQARCELLELALGVDPEELMNTLAESLDGMVVNGWTPGGLAEEDMEGVAWRVRIQYIAEVCRTRRGVLVQ